MGVYYHNQIGPFEAHGWFIDTPEGIEPVAPGDWIIMEATGQRSLCDPNDFERLYKLASTPPVHERLLSLCKESAWWLRNDMGRDEDATVELIEKLDAAIAEAEETP